MRQCQGFKTHLTLINLVNAIWMYSEFCGLLPFYQQPYLMVERFLLTMNKCILKDMFCLGIQTQKVDSQLLNLLVEWTYTFSSISFLME